jgi:hypothetical protein
MIETPISLIASIIHHEPEIGHMVWKHRSPLLFEARGQLGAASMAKSFNTRFAGTPALDCIDSRTGYKCGNIFAKRHQAHRVLWALTYGEWPEHDIDHINGVRHDNRISNLRAVDRAENLKNVKLRNSNTSGFNGVYWAEDRKKWRAEISANNKNIKLGSFDTLDDAIRCRMAANIKYGFHPNHGMR